MEKDHQYHRATLGDWLKAAPELNATIKDEDNEESRELLKELELPTNQFIDVSRQDFLKNPDGYLSQLHSEKYYVSTTQTEVPRRRAVQQDKAGVVEFASSLPPEYEALTIEESYPHVFSGRLLIFDSGVFYAEVAPGQLSMDEAPVAVVFGDTIWGDSYNKGSKSKELGPKLLETMNCIPHKSDRPDQLGVEYPSNVYEFILSYADSSHDEENLRPIFLKVIPEHTGQLDNKTHAMENMVKDDIERERFANRWTEL